MQIITADEKYGVRSAWSANPIAICETRLGLSVRKSDMPKNGCLLFEHGKRKYPDREFKTPKRGCSRNLHMKTTLLTSKLNHASRSKTPAQGPAALQLGPGHRLYILMRPSTFDLWTFCFFFVEEQIRCRRKKVVCICRSHCVWCPSPSSPNIHPTLCKKLFAITNKYQL